jgi:hypothetical protein
MFRQLRHQFDVLQRRQARNEIVELKDKADVLAPEARQSSVIGSSEVVVQARLPSLTRGCPSRLLFL